MTRSFPHLVEYAVAELSMRQCTGNCADIGMSEIWLLQQGDILLVKETTPTPTGLNK